MDKLHAARWIAAGLVIGVLSLLPAASQAAHVITETKESDTGVSTGTIKNIDLKGSMITVTGHEVFQEEKIKKQASGKSPTHTPKTKATKAAANTDQTLQVTIKTRITTIAKPTVALFSDLKVGDQVDVSFSVLSTGANVADTINPAQSQSPGH